MGYRDRIYSKYRETHLNAAPPTPENYAYQAKVHAKTFGALIPSRVDSKIFEVGCGSGSFLFYLNQAGYSNTAGMDPDKGSIEAAKSMGIAEAVQGDAFGHLAKSPGSYDCVVAIDVMEHLTKDELFEKLDVVLAALKPGGTFIWRSPNADGPFFGRVRYGDLTHELAFTKHSAWQLMKVAGFSDVEVYPENPIVTGARSLLRAVLWKLFALKAKLYLFAESYAQDSLLTANLIVRAKKG
jgi:2-polyprenyl-3-methyl-5-hydroxy-6-metoxy-1,4-benzoquinol methylase